MLWLWIKSKQNVSKRKNNLSKDSWKLQDLLLVNFSLQKEKENFVDRKRELLKLANLKFRKLNQIPGA